jgi:phosphoglucosamine mutase
MSNQTRQLFGTDGIRGVAGEFPLTMESTYLIGRALGHDLIRAAGKAQALIGQDTRESSAWIADRVAAGMAAVGVVVHSAGVITTPGVAYLARSRGFAAGVVISASHNPWTDNGIKVFSGDGFKLTDERELAIEKEIFALLGKPGAADDTALRIAGPSLPGETALRKAYIESLAGSVSSDLSGLRVLVDCANGAATAEAPELFRSLRTQATFIHVTPDGRNINEGCGALHPETLGRTVAESGGEFDLGVTFDGDADRALFCDARGRVVNGDGVLLLTARDLKAHGKLSGDIVVATTMSNMGVEIALKKAGIRMLRANVGDKYVLEEMLKTGATLGGEQSGHIIFRERSESVSAEDPECPRAGEDSFRAGARGATLHRSGRTRAEWKWARGGALFRNRGTGPRNGRSGVRREDARPDCRDCGRDSKGARHLRSRTWASRGQ